MLNIFLYVVIFTQGCLIHPVRAELIPTSNGTTNVTTSPQMSTTSTKSTVITSPSPDQKASEATTLGTRTTKQSSEQRQCYACLTTNTDSTCASADSIQTLEDVRVVMITCVWQCWTKYYANSTANEFEVERGCFNEECNELNTDGPYCVTIENATTCHHCCESNACNNHYFSEASHTWHCVHGYPTWIFTLLSLINLVVPITLS